MRSKGCTASYCRAARPKRAGWALSPRRRCTRVPKLSIPEGELMFSGHAACPGCGAALAMRYLLTGLGPETIMAMPACCWAVIGGAMPSTALHIALQDCAFEATGTADMGPRAPPGILERRSAAIYVMYDNEAYMNRGIQRSGATPKGAWTTTT